MSNLTFEESDEIAKEAAVFIVEAMMECGYTECSSGDVACLSALIIAHLMDNDYDKVAEICMGMSVSATIAAGAMNGMGRNNG